MHPSSVLAVLSLVLEVTSKQTVFSGNQRYNLRKDGRPLTGRFMHITDFHPDPFYKEGATIESGCHEVPKKDKKGFSDDGRRFSGDNKVGSLEKTPRKEGFAGKWGTGVSDCDSPMSLVNMTIDWLSQEWADEVDFVIWTGDSARHDLDRSNPRTPNEVFGLNSMMIEKMQAAFPGIPVVPSLGNNDIYPHNILSHGPNTVMSHYSKIWQSIIPLDLEHIFEKGGYFDLEVIPDRLAVISLNTMYWYKANTLADGCLDPKDPGSFEFEWLDIQLSSYRERGMQVWLIGHIPPHLGMYFDNCYLKYGDLALRYQDTIVGHLFGHMNVDHFFFIDVDELEQGAGVKTAASNATLHGYVDGPMPKIGPLLSGSSRYRTMGRSMNNGLQDELKKDFGEMPNAGKLKLKDYAVVNVAPSVIPTYFPGIRVFSYNISGLENELYWADLKKKKKKKTGHRHKKKPKDDCTKLENRDKPHCVFRSLPRYYDKTSPSRLNGPLTPLGYTQFYLPKVDSSKDDAPAWEIEYTTFHVDNLGLDGNMTQPPPIPMKFLAEYSPENETEREANGAADGMLAGLKKNLGKIAPWQLGDLTIDSYVKLARMLIEEKKQWKKFQDYMYVSSDT